MRIHFPLALMAAAAALMLVAAPARAAELKILEGNAVRTVLDELGPQFEKASGDTLNHTIGTTAQLKARIDGGEAFDVVILAKAALDELAAAGKVADAPRAAIAHAGIGVAIKKGAAKPDLTSVAAFKQTILQAKSIGVVDQTPTAAAMKVLFAKLGIAEQAEPKLTLLHKQAAAAVADGEVEIGLTQISEILADPRAELAGPLPAEIQTYTTFAAGVSAAAKNPAAAAALIKFLTAPDAAAAIRAKGMEPG